MKMPHIVIDTNVIISAQRSQLGAANKLISLIGTGKFEIHLSVPLVLEYESVLMRLRKELGLNQQDVYDLVDAFCRLGRRHNIHFLWRPWLPDEKDEMILELAVAAQCEYIVTYNRRDFVGAASFGLKVVPPHMVLREIGELL